MIVRHKATGQLYRELIKSWDIATQKIHVVFMQLETGRIYNRSLELFQLNHEIVNTDPQGDIKPEIDY